MRAIDKKTSIKLHVKRHILGKFLGMYRSLFRGNGIEYDEIRKYVPGDDRKSICWSKFAQLRDLYVKTYLEERDLTVLVALDISGSMFWRRPEKSRLALESAALLIYSAAINRDRVGLMLFSEGVERYIHPGRGMVHAGRVLQECMNIEQCEKRSLLTTSFGEIAQKRGPKKAIVFVLSDFISQEKGWEEALFRLAQRNDVLAVQITDLWEKNPTPLGWIYAQDPEDGRQHLVHCDSNFVEKMQTELEHYRKNLSSYAKSHNISFINIFEGQDPLEQMQRFFQKRCHVLRRA